MPQVDPMSCRSFTILSSVSPSVFASLSMFLDFSITRLQCLNGPTSTSEGQKHFQLSCCFSSIMVILAYAMHMTLTHACCMQAGDVAPLQEFGALFDDVKFRKGLQLNFTASKDGALITQVDDKEVLVGGSQSKPSVICCI